MSGQGFFVSKVKEQALADRAKNQRNRRTNAKKKKQEEILIPYYASEEKIVSGDGLCLFFDGTWQDNAMPQHQGWSSFHS